MLVCISVCNYKYTLCCIYITIYTHFGYSMAYPWTHQKLMDSLKSLGQLFSYLSSAI